jgi:hypothetical protein
MNHAPQHPSQKAHIYPSRSSKQYGRLLDLSKGNERNKMQNIEMKTQNISNFAD